MFKPSPVGFVKPVPDGVVTDLSVMSSQRTNEQLLLLGPMRFVNSDCSPNCAYNFSGDDGLVKLDVRRRISPGDEIFVKYGPEFFELNACRCRTCHYEKIESIQREEGFDILLEDVIFDFTTEFLQQLTSEQKKPSESQCSLPKRLRGMELVELYNDYSRQPDEICEDTALPNFGSVELTGSVQTVPTVNDNEIADQSSESDEDTDSESESNESSASDESLEVIHFVPRISSPYRNYEEVDCSVSTLSERDDLCFPDLSTEFEYQRLYNGSDLDVLDVSSLVELFCSRFNLSDEASTSLYSVIRAILPKDNCFPSGFSKIKLEKLYFSRQVRYMKKTPSETLCVLNFRVQLSEIVRRNLSQIVKYSEYRSQNCDADLNLSFSPKFRAENNSCNVNLSLFTDGVNIKKSTFKKELWPIWVQVLDLPPKLRMARKNIALAALFVGGKVPDWSKIVPELRNELKSPFDLSGSCDENLQILYHVRLLVCDLGAKSHVLNMFKFNGFYGCHYCTTIGKTIGKTHAYYPYGQSGDIREPSLNNLYVNFAECMPKDKQVSVVGVKGRSAFVSIVSDLPLSAPIDYMHCVLLGVFPETAKVCYKLLSVHEKQDLQSILLQQNCPRELIAYSRKIRSLEEIGLFKANECFNWLFYLSPVVFHDRLPANFTEHLNNLSFGMRLLVESSQEENVRTAEHLLDQFCKNIVAIHGGNEKIETINVHSLRHLCDQVRRFGPLFCYSAMSFEAANRTLGEVCSGSNNECEVICRRVLRRHRLHGAQVNSSRIREVFDTLSGASSGSNFKSFSDEMLETDSLKLGRAKNCESSFFNRYICDGIYFDSLCYKRSKLGNCYICYLENGIESFGQIQYFLKAPGPLLCEKMYAAVRKFSILSFLGPVQGFIYRVEETNFENLVIMEKVRKVFCYREKQQIFIVKLMSSFEHS